MNRGEQRIAESALAAFGLTGTTLTLVNADWNRTYRAGAADGRTYALRLYRPGGRSDAEIRVELGWLDALFRSGDGLVPRPIPTRDGEPFARVRGGGDERRAAVFDWIQGEPLGDHPDRELVLRFGEGIARLHQHGRTFRHTNGLQRWDSPFPQRGTAIVLDDANADLVARFERTVFERGVDRARDAIERLLATGEPARLVHGDLHQDNVVVDVRRDLWFLDFDDCMLAWPVQDLGVTMWEVGEDEATWPYRDALRAGYEQVAPWPERRPGEIDAFAADRGLIKVDDVVRQREHRDVEDVRVSVREHAHAIAWFLDRAIMT